MTAYTAEQEAAMQPKGQGQVPLTPSPDPWKHRSEHMRCRSCMWYVRKEQSGPAPTMEMGRCRKHAPSMNGFPVVFACEDWCGDHKLA